MFFLIGRKWKQKEKKDKFVVYVGSTCRENDRSLRYRIMEYNQMESHKKDEINEALRYKATIYVRTKCVPGKLTV